MTTPFADRLIEGVRAKNTPLCVGLDPFPDKIPALFGNAAEDTSTVLKFGTAIIDIAREHACVLKPQLGLFEQFGEMGYAVARMLCAYAKQEGMLVLLDAKRGDIGTTAEGYSRATIGGAPGFDADAVTVNPYMGKDTLEPFIQDLQVGGAPVWRRVAEILAPDCARLRGASGWSGLMAVAGATYPEEARILRDAMPEALFLVPGYGAQGASATDAVAGFVQAGGKMREGGVVSSSRAVLYPPAAQAATTIAEWRAAIGDAMA
ncbi:MAG: orotidine-5'-phosphate decarboxylase, partial [Terricaulis sp.]